VIVVGKGDTNGVDGYTMMNGQRRVNSAAADDVRVVGGCGAAAAVDIDNGTLMLWGSVAVVVHLWGGDGAHLPSGSVQIVAVAERDEGRREERVQGTRCVQRMRGGVVVDGDGEEEEVDSSHGQRRSQT